MESGLCRGMRGMWYATQAAQQYKGLRCVTCNARLRYGSTRHQWRNPYNAERQSNPDVLSSCMHAYATEYDHLT